MTTEISIAAFSTTRPAANKLTADDLVVGRTLRRAAATLNEAGRAARKCGGRSRGGVRPGDLFRPGVILMTPGCPPAGLTGPRFPRFAGTP
jgi:hypothetical protein